MITNQDLIQNAANSFMLISVSLSKWSGVAQVKDGSAQAAVQAGANPEAYRGYRIRFPSHSRNSTSSSEASAL